ncbi:MAG: hypothetical protein A4E73_00752 [Syntrophaceae bacterium PtaU1.Bin231]|nr:MAG: hypothetical protein A4E73_00752 [Syntrophaceae bacterium PtaU1.Bin231]
MSFAVFVWKFKTYMPYGVILSILSGLAFGYVLPVQAAQLAKGIIPLLSIMIYVMIIPTDLKEFVREITHAFRVGRRACARAADSTTGGRKRGERLSLPLAKDIPCQGDGACRTDEKQRPTDLPSFIVF